MSKIEVTKAEKDLIIHGLINECKSYINHGLNGVTEVGKHRYNLCLNLLKRLDEEGKYRYIYENWTPANLNN